MPRSAPRLLSFLFVVLALALPGAADEPAVVREAFRAAQEALRDRRYEEAAGALRAFRLAHASSPLAAEAWVLEARALLEARQARAALAATSDFLRAHGESAWAGRMRHLAADAHAALGAAGEAAAALRERVEAATSAAARAQIAARHLALAEGDFEGVAGTDDLGRPTRTRNLPRALAEVDRALAVGLTAPDAHRARETRARILEELGRASEAALAWGALLAERGLDELPAEGEPVPEAWRAGALELLGRGRARLAARQTAAARADLLLALRALAPGPAHLEALVLLARERLAHAASPAAFEEGVGYLRRAVAEYRDLPGAVAAQRALAEAHVRQGEPLKAAVEWRALAERFPQAPEAPEARYQAGVCLRQAGRFEEAVAEWSAFLAAWPDHHLWGEARAGVIEAAYARGFALKEAGEGEAAVRALEAFAAAHPGDSRAPGALLAAAEGLRELKRFDAAVAQARALAGRYAGDGAAPAALLLAALVQEDDLGQLEAAVAGYEELLKTHGRSPAAAQARARLERLKAKHLEVRLERVIGSGDRPVLSVATRNVEALDVRVYRLGLEEYFLRKGSIEGVEDLQLEIVKPDQTARWEVGGYRPLRLFVAEREVPVAGRGAYVVVAGDADLTATTLLLVSDLEIVVKRAPGRQLFVWAFERDTHAPVAGARVLASGQGVVGATGPDGVWQGPAGSDAAHVMVVAESGAAATQIAAGPVVAAGFSSKAHLATDRPVYRPGSEVAWRAVFLEAQGGGYLPPRERPGRLTVLDARGQALRTEPVVSSAFGTFAGRLRIDERAPLGTWHLQLDVEPYGTWRGAFEVQEFLKPEFTITVTPGRRSYRVGERVEARLGLAYAFGGPVAGARVAYEVWRRARVYAAPAADDYAWYLGGEPEDPAARTTTQGMTRVTAGTLVTDAAGAGAIDFVAERLDEDSEYLVRVAAQDVTGRWIVDEDRIPVLRADHLAAVRVDRQVVRPRQEVAVEVLTVDARERPVRRSGEVRVAALRRRPLPGPRGRPGDAVAYAEEEVVEQRHPLSTGADGRAELRLVIETPGRYRLRWHRADEQGHLVTAFTDLEVSGPAEDPLRDVRLVSARSLYREGEDAELLLRTPTGRGRVLLTYEGEQVLDYRFVDLSSTSTLLALPLEGRHAPNVFFAAAVPAPGGLLEAQAPVVVLRHLEVEVEVTPAEARPGDEVSVEVRARDAQGRPVRAELGVALVDETIYSIVRELAPPIRPWFYDRRRPHGVATASSLGTRFWGRTRETSKDLLADAEARTGGARRVAAVSALRAAREALARGDLETALEQGLRAAQADPASWDARAFLGELGARADVQERLADRLAEHGKALPADMPPAAEPAEGGWDARRAEKRSAPRPGAPAQDGAEVDELKSEDLEREESGDEGPGGLGVGGGAGGAFKGRGGGRAQGAANRWGAPARALPGSGTAPAALLPDALGGGALPGLGAFEIRRRFLDTAAFEPRVLTDEHGRARVKVRLPDNLTTWRATVRGVSDQALVGEGRGALRVRQDLLLRIDPPRFLVQGDELALPVAVHNLGDREVEAEVRLVAEGLDLGGRDGRVRVPAGGHAALDRGVAARAPGRARIEGRLGDALAGDALEVGLPVYARGLTVADGRSGRVDTARADRQEAFLEVPDGVVPGSVALWVALDPGVESVLFDHLHALEVFPYDCVEQLVHRFLPALEARAALLASGRPAAAALARLDGLVARGAERLRHVQAQDGSFGWFGPRGGDVAMTAYALRGLVGAQRAGVPGLETPIARAVAALRRLLPAAAPDLQALGHLALAEAGRPDAEAYAATFRRRNEELGALGLATLARAALAGRRAYDAEELVRLLLERRTEDGAHTWWKGRPGDCFTGSDREATGWAVAALVEAGQPGAHAERAMAWLRSPPAGARPTTTKERAAFVTAASAWMRAGREQAFGGTLEVLLDGRPVRTVAVGAGPLDPADRRFFVPEARDLGPGRHALAFVLRGQGNLGWAARLDAVVASPDLPGETHGLEVERRWLAPATAVAPGQPPPPQPGYEILREAARPKVEPRELDTVARGDKVLVRIEIEAPRDLQYLLVEDPLPAGCEVLDDTARGPFDWQERRDDRQVFFLSQVPRGTHVLEYLVQATHAGGFTARGARAVAMYAPEIRARSPGRTLRILSAPPAGGGGEVLPTPDERYAEALALFDRGAFAEARARLDALKRDEPLRDEILVEIEVRLLAAAIALGDPRAVVAAREELLRRDPARLPQDLDGRRALAFAYHDLGEHEVAAGLFRELIVEGFALHVHWAATLTARGREVEALDGLGQELRAWPLVNATAAAALARAQRYADLRRPPGRGEQPAGEPMDAESLEALARLTAHGAHLPVAAPAHYALVGTLARRGMSEAAAREAEAFLRRYPDSHYLDDARWFLCDARYQAFEAAPEPAAAAAVRQAAEPLTRDDFPQPRGAPGPSVFRPRAWHLLARVEHVLGNLDRAIELYRQAGDLEDAREALAFLTEERLELDPVVRLSANQPARIPVRYRNVADLSLKVYAIDLQALFALRKTLLDLHRVDLSGIVPQRQWTAPLVGAADHQAHAAALDLPLDGQGFGVWLVVAKAGPHEGSTLVVRSDLHVALQPLGGKLRAYVSDGAGAPVRAAYVTVSDGTRVVARGLTDGRGVFDAPGASGAAFVVASKDDRYALAGGPDRPR